MQIVTAAASATLRAADAATASAAGPGWWDVASGLLLAAAGAWATWAQFIYPKIAERKAKAGGEAPPVASTPQAAPGDLVGVMFRDQAQRLDDVLDQLEAAHRKHARDAGTMARLTAELAECRRHVCPPTYTSPGGPP